MTRTAPPSTTVPAGAKATPNNVGFAGRPASDRFSICLAALLRAEGGFNDIAADRGGATNFGISLRFLRAEAAINPAIRALFPDGPIDATDIRSLTIDQAAKIYLWCFWLPLNCDALPAQVDHAVFDQAVNAGARTAVRLLQRAVNTATARYNTLLEDGAFGQKTLLAVKALPADQLAAAMRTVAAARYRALAKADPSQNVFLAGWLARAAKLGSV